MFAYSSTQHSVSQTMDMLVVPSRIASLSKIFPTLMLYRLWEDGKVGSLDDPLEKYVDNFTIKNPLGRTRDSELKYVTDGLIFLDSGEVQIRSSSVTLRRMASQLSGQTHRLSSTFSLTITGKQARKNARKTERKKERKKEKE